jgi:hypothetical protein
MTTATDDVLTADDVSRMTGVPDSTLHDWAAKRERGVGIAESASLQVVIAASAMDSCRCCGMARRAKVLSDDDSQA